MERKDVNRIDWKDKEGGGRRGDKYKLLNCCRKSQGRAATTLVLVRPEWLHAGVRDKTNISCGNNSFSVNVSSSSFLSWGVFSKGIDQTKELQHN